MQFVCPALRRKAQRGSQWSGFEQGLVGDIARYEMSCTNRREAQLLYGGYSQVCKSPKGLHVLRSQGNRGVALSVRLAEPCSKLERYQRTEDRQTDLIRAPCLCVNGVRNRTYFGPQPSRRRYAAVDLPRAYL